MISGIARALHLPDAPASNPPRGLALIEVLIILTIVLILALLAAPTFVDMTDTGRAKAMAVTARHVRELIGYKAAAHAAPFSAAGFPIAIDEGWFPSGRLPYHAWTNEPLKVETVVGRAGDIYPRVKTFDPADPDAPTAWYNATNGAFCVRIPPQAFDAETLATFNIINGCNAAGLEQTTD